MGINLGVKNFGVIRFVTCVQSLKQCHTEERRGRRIIKTKQWKSRRHRRCIEQRSLLANSISNLYTKRLPQNSYQEFVRYTSVALLCRRHLRDIVFSSVPSVTLCAYYIRRLVSHSIFGRTLYKAFSFTLHISEEPYYFYINVFVFIRKIVLLYL